MSVCLKARLTGHGAPSACRRAVGFSHDHIVSDPCRNLNNLNKRQWLQEPAHHGKACTKARASWSIVQPSISLQIQMCRALKCRKYASVWQQRVLPMRYRTCTSCITAVIVGLETSTIAFRYFDTCP
jgi:hypothetical protein